MLHGALLSISAGRAHGNSETSHATGATANRIGCAAASRLSCAAAQLLLALQCIALLAPQRIKPPGSQCVALPGSEQLVLLAPRRNCCLRRSTSCNLLLNTSSCLGCSASCHPRRSESYWLRRSTIVACAAALCFTSSASRRAAWAAVHRVAWVRHVA